MLTTIFCVVDDFCKCYETVFSRAYLHHLFKAHEATAHTLASIHNIRYMVKYNDPQKQDTQELKNVSL